MLRAATDLLNKEICLPQTTSMEKAEEVTSEYRKQLQTTKEDLLKRLEVEYNVRENRLVLLLRLIATHIT